MVRLPTLLLSAVSLAPSQVLGALQVDLDDPASIKRAAAQKVEDLLSYYHGDEPGGTPGVLPGPPPAGDYYWWMGGAMWGTILDYRYYTGDKTYDDMVMAALVHQRGEGTANDFMPSNWTASMGNDDQAFWAMAALTAAEVGFLDPVPTSLGLDWLAMAQAVFNEQTESKRRTQAKGCDGMLRWQAYYWNNGWDYINTISNMCYFNMGARLARYFNNETLADMVEKTYDLVRGVKYIDDQGNVYDGAHEGDACTIINHSQFSYNAAVTLQGLAHLFNMTNGAEKWKSKIDLILPRTLDYFFPNGTAFEWACETGTTCTADMLSFKGYLHRWLAQVAFLAPYTEPKITPLLRSSTKAAVAQCTGGANQRMCGFKWTSGVFDMSGAGQEMNVVAALISLLPYPNSGVLTNTTGGTSKGDPNAGAGVCPTCFGSLPAITTGDRAGAGIVTAIVLVAGLVTFSWISFI